MTGMAWWSKCGIPPQNLMPLVAPIYAQTIHEIGRGIFAGSKRPGDLPLSKGSPLNFNQGYDCTCTISINYSQPTVLYNPLTLPYRCSEQLSPLHQIAGRPMRGHYQENSSLGFTRAIKILLHWALYTLIWRTWPLWTLPNFSSASIHFL